MADEAAQTIPLEFAGEIRDVPVENAQAAINAGYREVTPEEVSHWDAKAEYERNTAPVVQGAKAFATGAASGVLSLPALASNILPGVEGQSGHKWLAGVKAFVEGKPPEEIEEELRVIAESSDGWHMAGDVAGSLTGTGLVGGLAKAGMKAAGKTAASQASKLAGVTAESIASSVAMANEEAFVHNKELTAEIAMASALVGSLGPLAMRGAIVGSRKLGQKAANKIDSVRLDKFNENVAAGVATDPPVMLEKLFGNSKQSLDALADLSDSMAGSSQKLGSAIKRSISQNSSAAIRRDLRMAMGFGMFARQKSVGRHAAAIAFDTVVAPMVGSLAGRLVTKYGGAASGMFFNGAAKSFRAVARNARIAATKSPSTFSPLGILASGLSRAAWHERVGTLFDEASSTVDESMRNQQNFINQVGDTFGGLEHAENGSTVAITQQYAKGMKYLALEKPAVRPLYPGMPHLGMTRPPVQEQESYLRKWMAVQNPLLLLSELQSGQVNHETVGAVSTVYPSLYMDMVTEVAAGHDERGEQLTRQQKLALSKFFAGAGAVFGAQSPRYMAQLHTIYSEAQGVQHKPDPRSGNQGGSANPSLAQSMRTGSQKAASSIYN